MGRADFLELGSWNFVCFRCGRKTKSSVARKQWQGYWVCDREGCWEPRQPQDYAKGVADLQAPPWTQPPSGDVFIHFCTPNSRTALPGYGIPGCVIPGVIDPAFDPSVRN